MVGFWFILSWRCNYFCVERHCSSLFLLFLFVTRLSHIGIFGEGLGEDLFHCAEREGGKVWWIVEGNIN